MRYRNFIASVAWLGKPSYSEGEKLGVFNKMTLKTSTLYVKPRRSVELSCVKIGSRFVWGAHLAENLKTLSQETTESVHFTTMWRRPRLSDENQTLQGC